MHSSSGSLVAPGSPPGSVEATSACSMITNWVYTATVRSHLPVFESPRSEVVSDSGSDTTTVSSSACTGASVVAGASSSPRAGEWRCSRRL